MVIPRIAIAIVAVFAAAIAAALAAGFAAGSFRRPGRAAKLAYARDIIHP
jgi:hypothetical protein